MTNYENVGDDPFLEGDFDIGIDQILEIYLDQRQFTYWMQRKCECNNVFTLLAEKVKLKDLFLFSTPPPPLPSELQLLVLRMYGPQTSSDKKAISAPKPLRRLQRKKGEVWTVFYYGGYVFGVHDDGTVVSRYVNDFDRDHEYRFTPEGLIFKHQRSLNKEVLLHPTESFFDFLVSALDEWLKLDKYREMPLSIQRMIERID